MVGTPIEKRNKLKEFTKETVLNAGSPVTASFIANQAQENNLPTDAHTIQRYLNNDFKLYLDVILLANGQTLYMPKEDKKKELKKLAFGKEEKE